ncbi:coiled-coil-helix-coiled-coil-helix domain containing 3 [Turdus rufiventris]|nr:coiled-coil-helix-coiled-coil-helix domain containing 3 [Turdus rufiventris]
MGGGGSTRRVTFEADENENITVVKGVRLSDSVIDRMKEPSGRQHRGSGAGLLLVFNFECEKRNQICPSEHHNELIALFQR